MTSLFEPGAVRSLTERLRDARVEADRIIADVLPSGALRDAVSRVIDADDSSSSVHRLFPVVVGASAGLPAVACQRIAALALIWWSGAETMDDLMDGEYEAQDVGLTRSDALLASIACTSLVPTLGLSRCDVAVGEHLIASDLCLAWSQEYARASLTCASGQLADVAVQEYGYDWRMVMQTYGRKTGSAYGRDMALAALSLDLPTETVDSWRTCGILFGVLRQLVNDRNDDTRLEASDLSNATPTLRLAHLLEQDTGRSKGDVLDIYRRAGVDPAARAELYELWGHPATMAGYNRRMHVIGASLTSALEEILDTPLVGEVATWMISTSVLNAQASVALG